MCLRTSSSALFVSLRRDTLHLKFVVHLEKIRYIQLCSFTGPIRKAKYVESPRVPGEAILLLRKQSEQEEPSQNGRNLFSDTLSIHVKESDKK